MLTHNKLDNWLSKGTPSARIGALIFNTAKQVDDFHAQCLGHKVQARERDVHSSRLKCAYLCPVKSRQVREFVLCPAAFQA